MTMSPSSMTGNFPSGVSCAKTFFGGWNGTRFSS
jgi:hypothetical protein